MFHPFDHYLNLPAFFVEIGYMFSGQWKIIGKKLKSPFFFPVKKSDQTDFEPAFLACVRVPKMIILSSYERCFLLKKCVDKRVTTTIRRSQGGYLTVFNAKRVKFLRCS